MIDCELVTSTACDFDIYSVSQKIPPGVF